jgi:hypothetical protein
MPRFYFAVRCQSISKDIGHLDLPDLAAAYTKAVRATQAHREALVAEEIDLSFCSIEISDWSHLVVGTVPFRPGPEW